MDRDVNLGLSDLNLNTNLSLCHDIMEPYTDPDLNHGLTMRRNLEHDLNSMWERTSEGTFTPSVFDVNTIMT